MTNAFDDRLVSLEIDVDGQKIKYDQNYYIIAQGTRFTNGNFGECNLRIDNISKKTRDYLVGRTSQWAKNRTTANIFLNVGRASYGTFQMFAGQAIAGSPTQPPDIGLVLRSLSQAALFGYANAFAAPQNATVKDICGQIAQTAGIELDFQAKNNPNIGNYHFTGALAKQIKSLNDLGVSAYIDPSGSTLVVTDINTPRKLPTIEVNAETGMIGVPEITEVGVRVIMLIKNEIKIGSPVKLTSVVNPSVNGNYYIYKLGFQIASRDIPFYWIMDLRPADLALGVQ